jgi:hypothetical protein
MPIEKWNGPPLLWAFQFETPSICFSPFFPSNIEQGLWWTNTHIGVLCMVKEIPKISKYYKYPFTSSTQWGSFEFKSNIFVDSPWPPWLALTYSSKARVRPVAGPPLVVTEVHNFQNKKRGPYKSVRYLLFPKSTLHFCKGMSGWDLNLRTKIDFVGPHFDFFLIFLNIQ